MSRFKSTQELAAVRAKIQKERDPERTVLSVCGGTGCHAYGCVAVAEAVKQSVASHGLGDRVTVTVTGCHGFCERGPLVVVRPKGILYQQVKVDDVEDILSKTVEKGEVLERLLWTDPEARAIVEEAEVPFYRHQQRLIFGQNGHLDPRSLEDYLAIDGYEALAKALTEMTPEQVIEEVERAGLRGRCGAGFPTGRKWRIARSQPGEEKYVVCNADEGDPGAYMDRSLLEGNPHAVLEGMAIGGYAVGASKAFIYVRNEYPLAVENARVAIDQARQVGLLGEGLFGTDFSFDVEISRGAGAFVCGEETGLIASIEGRVGEPRDRPPFPAQAGLWGKPTNINNVETWANVPMILRKGASWYASIGTEGSKGTKIFSMVGKVRNTGLVEVPMGTTLRKIVFEIGGGPPEGRSFKAVQTGGPSGGCLPQSKLDMPVDFDALTEAGSMMGSGGLIVMDDRTCMVDVARYFLSFLVEESCGKCVPCREGSRRMHQILERICGGEGVPSDMDTLERLGRAMQRGSLCGLGKTAANPVLSTMRYFREEYEAHIDEHRCPAAVCRALITYTINDKCNGCTLCARVCPQKAITGEKKGPHVIDQTKCDRCGVCYESCKFGAIDVA